MKRPLLQVGALYVAGILAADLIAIPAPVLVCSALALTSITLVWSRGRPLCLAALVLAAGATNLTLHTAILSPTDLRAILGQQPELGTVRGVLTETPTVRVYQQDEQLSWRTLARIAVSRVSIEKQPSQWATGVLAVSTPAQLTNLFAGQEVEVSGVIAKPKSAVAEGTFDYRDYLREQGIYFQLQAGSEEDWKILHSPAKAPMADRFRTWARQALARGLPAEDETLRLEWALTLGWKPGLTEEVSEAFVQAAT